MCAAKSERGDTKQACKFLNIKTNILWVGIQVTFFYSFHDAHVDGELKKVRG